MLPKSRGITEENELFQLSDKRVERLLERAQEFARHTDAFALGAFGGSSMTRKILNQHLKYLREKEFISRKQLEACEASLDRFDGILVWNENVVGKPEFRARIVALIGEIRDFVADARTAMKPAEGYKYRDVDPSNGVGTLAKLAADVESGKFLAHSSILHLKKYLDRPAFLMRRYPKFVVPLSDDLRNRYLELAGKYAAIAEEAGLGADEESSE